MSCDPFGDEFGDTLGKTFGDKLVSCMDDKVVGNGISPTELSKQAALKLSERGFQIDIHD